MSDNNKLCGDVPLSMVYILIEKTNESFCLNHNHLTFSDRLVFSLFKNSSEWVDGSQTPCPEKTLSLVITTPTGGIVKAKGIDCGETCQADYNPDTIVTLTANPTTGFSFDSWSGDCSGTSATTTFTMDTAKSCTANFAKQTVEKVTLAITAPTGGTIIAKGIKCGQTCKTKYAINSTVALTAIPTTGFSFDSWSGDCTGTSTTTTVTMDIAKNCSANFATIPENSLIVNKTGDGKGTISAKLADGDWTNICNVKCQQSINEYAPDTEVDLIASPYSGFTFQGWSGDCTGTTKRTTVTVDSIKTCTAQFEPELTATHQLTVNHDGTGNGTITSHDSFINCGTDCTEYYRIDKKIWLTATPTTDSLFTNWSGNSQCTGSKTRIMVTMNAAKSCTATFNTHDPDEIFTLTASKTGNGQGNITGWVDGAKTLACKPGCTEAKQDYSSGAKVKLTALPRENYIFTGWGGNCSGSQKNFTVLMDSAKTCTATFVADSSVVWQKLTVNSIGTGNGTITVPIGINCDTNCITEYPQGVTVRITATANSL